MEKQKRLVLINPGNPAEANLSINRISRFPPLGLGIVAALTPASWEVELIDENWEPFAYRNADLVGITAFTSAAPRAYQIAAQYRARGVPVVMGGIHASMCPAEALRFVDAVVVGEAESVWPRVVTDAEVGRLEAIYRAGWPDLTDLSRPRRDLYHPSYILATVQTARGCPMDCEFCSVSAFNQRQYRRRPVEEVLDELETIPNKMVFFVDDNLIGHSRASREQALALFRGMVERRLHKWWFCQACLDFADDRELLAWAARAGCKMVFLGLESERMDALAEINKRPNLERGVEQYKRAFRRIHRAGIAVFAGMIFGLDSDTPDRLHRRFDYMISSAIDAMQPTFLTPLPGTRLYDRLQREDRLRCTGFPGDWQHYDFSRVVYQPFEMDADVLWRTVMDRCRDLYSWSVLARKALRALLATHSPVATWFAWQANVTYRKIALGKLGKRPASRSATRAKG